MEACGSILKHMEADAGVWNHAETYESKLYVSLLGSMLIVHPLSRLRGSKKQLHTC